MRRAAVDRQSRAARDVAHLGVLLDCAFREARPEFLRWKHLVLPLAAVVPLCAGRDLERAPAGRHVDAGEIEGEGGDAAVLVGVPRGGEVAVPGLPLGA